MEHIWESVEHHYADSAGTKLHYVTCGAGEPIVFIHGFPDFWYTWRYQMAALAPSFKVIAIDMRGYNLSDKPQGIENYKMPYLLDDIRAVIADAGEDKVTVVGHDWGGAISWHFAMSFQAQVERLIILNLTHPKGYATVAAAGSAQQKANVQYAYNFATSAPTGGAVPDNVLALGERDASPGVGERYREALARSYWDGMMNYYRANYVDKIVDIDPAAVPDITCPVLQFHGLQDNAVDKDGLLHTWNWVANDYTLVTTPTAGHFVQWEAKNLVCDTMKWWLAARSQTNLSP